MSALAAALITDEGLLVDKILRCMLMREPNMYARYSEAAPARTREDVAFHIQFLVGALTAGDPEIFADYYDWLLGILLPRGVIQEDIDLNFACMAEVLEESYGDDSATALSYMAPAMKRTTGAS